MAINFPNDPATDPGDGNTWVDPDGNTWLVEIVSGEAIWTMTEAADTGGGGGGAVDSVNGETGVVELGIQDMDDYALGLVQHSWTWSSEQIQVPASGVMTLVGTTFSASQYDLDGVLMADKIVQAPTPSQVDKSVVVSVNGTVVYQGLWGDYDNINSSRFQFLMDDVAWTASVVDGDTVAIGSAPVFGEADLAEGDILQWNDADQKFKPTQLGDAGTPLDGLLSVDGDAVTYDIAPTLGVDATDLVIPTMGQVRGAIASNGGTSVSLNDLSDVSYTSGSFEPDALDQVVFSSSDVPSDATWKFYVNDTYGLNFGAYLSSTTEGAYIKAHHQKGVLLQGDNGLPIWLTGNVGETNNQPELRFSNGTPWSGPTGKYIGFKMPAGVTEDVTWTLPATDGLANYVLSTDGAGNLTFTAPPSPAEAIRQYDIDYEGLTAYKFTGPGLDGTEENPAIYVSRGDGIVFSNLLGAHPFQLQTVAGTGETAYTDGVTGAQPISVGSFEWVVPMDAPSTLFYQCTAHTAMSGVIYVLDNSGGGGGAGAVESVNSQTGVVSLGIQDMDDYALAVNPSGFSTYDFTDSWPTLPTSTYTNRYNADLAGAAISINWNTNAGQLDQELVDDVGALLAGDVITVSLYNRSSTVYYLTLEEAPSIFSGSGYTLPIVDDADWQAFAAEDPNAVPEGLRIVVGDTRTVPNIPLADGDILQWNNTDQKFKPAALIDNDTKRIQDMDDFELNPVSGTTPVTRTTDFNTDSNTPSGYVGLSRGYLDEMFFNYGPEGRDTGTILDYLVNEASVPVDVDISGTTYEVTKVEEVSDTVVITVNGGYVTPSNGTTWVLSLPDSATVNLANGDILQWSNADQKFKPTQPSSSPSALDDLTDVDADSPTEGDTLTWDGTSWKPTAPPTGPSRNSVVITTAALAIGATEAGEITGTGLSGLMLSVQTNTAAWIRLYTDSQSSSLDAGRTKDDDPVPGSGVLFEALYTTFTEKPITPGTTYFNLAGEDKLYYRITNESVVGSTPISVTFKLLPLES